jgi:peptidoglycan/LPS O-acetylase OafA/YrhL
LIGLCLIPVLMYFRIALESTVSLKNIDTIEILIAFGIVYCLFHNKARLPLLDGRLFGYLGTISYSVYVLHFPIVFALAAGFVKFFGSSAIEQQPLLMATLLGALTLLITVPLSMVTNRYVEDGGNDFGKRLVASWYNKPRHAAVIAETVEER